MITFPGELTPESFCLNFSCRVSASWHNRKPLSNLSMKLSAVISTSDAKYNRKRLISHKRLGLVVLHCTNSYWCITELQHNGQKLAL